MQVNCSSLIYVVVPSELRGKVLSEVAEYVREKVEKLGELVLVVSDNGNDEEGERIRVTRDSMPYLYVDNGVIRVGDSGRRLIGFYKPGSNDGVEIKSDIYVSAYAEEFFDLVFSLACKYNMKVDSIGGRDDLEPFAAWILGVSLDACDPFSGRYDYDICDKIDEVILDIEYERTFPKYLCNKYAR